jgi:hypothetical protein
VSDEAEEVIKKKETREKRPFLDSEIEISIGKVSLF